MTNLIVSGATVRAGGATILRDASVDFESYSVTGIIGPNGAGKSTLLAVAAGERNPDAGTVTLGGEDIAHLSTRHLARRRAVMPQDTSVAFPFTVREVVTMGRTAWGESAAVSDRIAADALEQVGLTEFADRSITTLSGGEHQLVAFARVMVQATPVGPDSIILLDEPTAAMDIAHAETTLATARLLAAQGAAVGVVLHDLDAAAAYADRLVLMEHGRIRRSGSVAEVCRAEELSQAYGTPIEVFHHGGRLRVAPSRVTVG